MTMDEQRSRKNRIPAIALAVLLVLAGAVALIVAARAPGPPPQPAQAAAAAPTSSAAAAPSATSAPETSPGSSQPGAPETGLPASPPVRLEIPAIGVKSDLLQLGLNPDNTLEVPPLAKDSRAGWFRGSPAPGQVGPSTLLGHVDSVEYGPGIFYKVGALKPGDTATVTRADGKTVVFRVDRVVTYPKDQFPTLAVYGNTDNPQLRLITCGGAFDPKAHNYLDNIVAFASMVSSSS
jgi:hypothetical protein